MKEIFIITDYKGRFGSKHKEKSFRSGFDLALLSEYFSAYEINTRYLKFADVDFRNDWKGKIVIYSSAEDCKGYYKSYIEDVIYGLELAGAYVVPQYKFLKAHNNKVFMEILRDLFFPNDRIISYKFGNLEELMAKLHIFEYPVVLKSYEGAVSRNVRMCYSERDIFKAAKKLMKSPNLKEDLKELYRSYKCSPYKPDSRFRKKGIVQNMIKGLENDWKVLVFGDKLYKLKRLNRIGDPRASGSGRFIFDKEVDSEILDFAMECYKKFNVPVASLDIAKDELGCILIEFQFVTFGTKTLENSDHYYIKEAGNWIIVNQPSILEKEFAKSYSDYFQKNNYFKNQ
jgi:glutathione synthase/RimK-type ligase-like ATP-grasp enzyme